MNSIGRYQLLEKLGQGGMGVVYRAFDTLLQRVVAVKVIAGTLENSGEQRERFFREARAAGQLSHRNIITIHDLGEHEGQPYLAMEYLEGEDLQRRLARPERMSLARKVELAVEICEGLEYAHARGVVHRDIKPANIFITDNGTAKILDFGLARLVTSQLTNSNMMMGTINYMAPEQVRGERADHRSDIFSVGVVLYELFGGRKAFDGDSFASTLYNILQTDPPSLLDIDPRLPPDLAAIVHRALAKPRDERYQHMSELLTDLAVHRQQFAAYDSPVGRPASAGHTRRSDPPRAATSPSSDAPTVAHPATPVPAHASDVTRVASRSGSASGSVAVPGPAKRPILLAGAAVVLVVLGATTFWLLQGGQPAADDRSTAATPAAAEETKVAAELRQATQALERSDFDAAERHADVVLAMTPGHTQARQLKDQAVSTRARATQGIQDARAHLAAGRYQDASRVAGDVLSLVPGHEEARALMQDAAERSRGEGAETARARMNQAKSDARSVDAPNLAPVPYRGALAAERAAEQMYGRRQLAEATAKFYEASGLFQSARLAAQTETASRAERAVRSRTAPAVEPAIDKPAAAPPRAEPSAPSPAPPAAPAANPVLPLPTGKPVVGGAGSSLPGTGTPIGPPPPPLPAEPSAQSLIADVLTRYESALEARSLAALKRIWPGLSGSQETAIRDEFEHARLITVEIVAPRIEVSGETATATFTRRYEISTTDGQRFTRVSLTTMRLRRGSGGWGIEQVRFEPVR